jgi:hypothetical protein
MSCSTQAEPESFYVIVAPNEAELYYVDMIRVVEQHRLDANPGTARDSDGRGTTDYVVEGKGRGVRVWSANLPMSAPESVACGGPNRPGIYPSQFKVTVFNRSLFGEEQVSTVTSELMASLREKGYDVRTEPELCTKGTAGP